MKKTLLPLVLLLTLTSCEIALVTPSPSVNEQPTDSDVSNEVSQSELVSEQESSLEESAIEVSASEETSSEISIDSSTPISEEPSTSVEEGSKYYTPSYLDSTYTKAQKSVYYELENCGYIEHTNDYGFYNFNISDLTNVMEAPTEVNSVSELADVLDYCAFYNITQYNVTVNYSFESVQSELSYAFWSSSLLPGTVGVDGIYDDGQFKLYFFFYDAAKYTFENYLHPATSPYTLNYVSYDRTDTFDNFAYTKFEKTLDVYNSEQLFYALEHGYNVNCAVNSPAERVLNEAKKILRNIISDEMDESEKIAAMYNYIISNAVYDSYGDGQGYRTSDTLIQSDMTFATLESNYIEGVLFSGKGVCHGFAKTIALFMSMEGIDTHKVSGYHSEINPRRSRRAIISDGTYYAHGYVYTKLSGTDTYFMVDPTFSYAFRMDAYDAYMFRAPAILLGREQWSSNIYTEVYDVYSDIYPTSYSMNSREIMKFEGTDGVMYDNSISSSKEAEEFALYLASLPKETLYSVNFYFEDLSYEDDFLSVLNSYANIYFNYASYNFVVNYGYMVIFTNN